MGNKNRPVLSSEDYRLMERIHKHNFVDMIYIYHFYKVDCKKRTVQDRIVQLANYRYITVINTFVPPEYTATQKTVYKIVSLGTAGVKLLRSLGFDVDDNSSTLRNASPYLMYHQVQVSTVCDIIEKMFAEGESNHEVAQILNEKEAYLEEGGYA